MPTITIENTISFSLGAVLTYLIQLFVSHYLTIGRDKRKEFNAIAEEITLAFIKERQFVANANTAHGGPKDSDFNRLAFKLSRYKLRKFNTLLKEYNENKRKNTKKDKYGQESFHDNSLILKSIDKLIKFTKPR